MTKNGEKTPFPLWSKIVAVAVGIVAIGTAIIFISDFVNSDRDHAIENLQTDVKELGDTKVDEDIYRIEMDDVQENQKAQTAILQQLRDSNIRLESKLNTLPPGGFPTPVPE